MVLPYNSCSNIFASWQCHPNAGRTSVRLKIPFRFPSEMLTHDVNLFWHKISKWSDAWDNPSYRALDHLQNKHTIDLTDVDKTFTLMTPIVWSIVRCIVGAKNIVRCAYDYDWSFDLIWISVIWFRSSPTKFWQYSQEKHSAYPWHPGQPISSLQVRLAKGSVSFILDLGRSPIGCLHHLTLSPTMRYICKAGLA